VKKLEINRIDTAAQTRKNFGANAGKKKGSVLLLLLGLRAVFEPVIGLAALVAGVLAARSTGLLAAAAPIAVGRRGPPRIVAGYMFLFLL